MTTLSGFRYFHTTIVLITVFLTENDDALNSAIFLHTTSSFRVEFLPGNLRAHMTNQPFLFIFIPHPILSCGGF